MEFKADDGIKMLLYGMSATGKTTCWATFPGPILAIVCSGGRKPGELRSVNTPEYRRKIFPVTLYSSDEMGELLTHVNESKKYKTVVLDHASGLQDLVLCEILGLQELPAQKSWGLASQQQYGQCTTKCKEWLRGLLNLDTNVVLVAQEREYKSDSDSELIRPNVGAGLMPSLTSWLNPACDYIVNTFIRGKEVITTTTIGEGDNAEVVEMREKVRGQVEFCLRTAPHEVYTTKFRVPKGSVLPDVIVNPDYAKIMAVINGNQRS